MAGSAGQTLQQVAEAAHAHLPEHIQLELNLAAMLALGVTSAEYAVPEQGNLFLQRPLGVNHPVGKISLVDFQGVHLFPVDELALQNVHLQIGLGFPVEQVFNRGLVALLARSSSSA